MPLSIDEIVAMLDEALGLDELVQPERREAPPPIESASVQLGPTRIAGGAVAVVRARPPESFRGDRLICGPRCGDSFVLRKILVDGRDQRTVPRAGMPLARGAEIAPPGPPDGWLTRAIRRAGELALVIENTGRRAAKFEATFLGGVRPRRRRWRRRTIPRHRTDRISCGRAKGERHAR